MRKRRQIELAAAPPFSLFDPHCLESYGVSTKHKIQTNNAEKPPKTAVFQRFLVGVRGLEPRASCSQSRRATNCATPRYLVFYGFRMYTQSRRATNCATPQYSIKPHYIIAFWGGSVKRFSLWSKLWVGFKNVQILEKQKRADPCAAGICAAKPYYYTAWAARLQGLFAVRGALFCVLGARALHGLMLL